MGHKQPPTVARWKWYTRSMIWRSRREKGSDMLLYKLMRFQDWKPTETFALLGVDDDGTIILDHFSADDDLVTCCIYLPKHRRLQGESLGEDAIWAEDISPPVEDGWCVYDQTQFPRYRVKGATSRESELWSEVGDEVTQVTVRLQLTAGLISTILRRMKESVRLKKKDSSFYETTYWSYDIDIELDRYNDDDPDVLDDAHAWFGTYPSITYENFRPHGMESCVMRVSPDSVSWRFRPKHHTRSYYTGRLSKATLLSHQRKLGV